MDIRSSAPRGRRVVSGLASRLTNTLGLLLLGLFGLAWSGQSLAQSSCGITAVSSTAQSGPAGGNLVYTYALGLGCGTELGTFAITADTTGGATISTPTWNQNAGTQFSVTVTLGATPGGTGTLQTQCVGGFCGAGGGQVLVVATFATNNSFNFVASSPTTVIANQITPFTVATNLQINGSPGGLNTQFSVTSGPNYGNFTPGPGGTATTTQSLSTAGSYTVVGSLQCPLLFVLPGCAAVPPVNFNVVIEPVGVTVVGSPTPATPAGTPLPLAVTFGSASIAAPDGTNITWSVGAQPPGGDGAVAGNAVAGGGGQSNASFTATVPGTYTVFANSGCIFCAPGSRTFTINVTALPFVLLPVTPNPLAGTAGTGVPVTVRLEQGGLPVAGATIAWIAGAPFAPTATTSVTNAAAGEATATFTPSTFGSFTNVISASFDPDGIPANGDEITLGYNANIAFVASLAIAGGNSQNALVSTPFTTPLQVNALNSGVPAAGVTINWAITAGTATLSAATSATNGAGNAAISVTAGATPGPVTLTAMRQDDPAATVTFNLTVDALGSLTVIGGDGQLLKAGVASAPLVVELTNAGGAPVAGAVVNWTTSGGTLASATSTTNTSGIASNTVTTTAAGALQVTASSALAAAPAVFDINGALASLGGLTATQREVAQAIDSACPALAALTARTPGQQDLLQRCQELIGASGIDPAATIAALDQLMADVALTQVNAAFNTAQSQFINLKTRIAALRSGSGGTDFGGLALNTSMGPVSLGMLSSAFTSNAAETEVGTDFSRWGFFAAGTIGRGEADAGSRSPGYDFDVEGVTAGVDYRQSDKWIIGGSFGYTRQDTQLPGDRGGLDTTGWSVSAYTTYYQADSWYMDGVLTYGRNDYELLRQISYTLPVAGGGTTRIDQVAQADAGGDLLSTALTVGRDFNLGAVGIGPYARVLYTRLGFDDINEELLPGVPGSGLGLRIENRDVTSLASVLGAKFTYAYSAGWGVLMPHLQLEWEHEFEDDPQAIEARFINDPTGSAMLVSGDPLDTDYFRLGLGLSMVFTGGRSGFFYYERLMGMNGMSQYNLALGFRMEF